MSDRPRGHGFDLRSGRNCVTTLGKLFTPTCLDVDSLRYYMELLNRGPLRLFNTVRKYGNKYYIEQSIAEGFQFLLFFGEQTLHAVHGSVYFIRQTA